MGQTPAHLDRFPLPQEQLCWHNQGQSRQENLFGLLSRIVLPLPYLPQEHLCWHDQDQGRQENLFGQILLSLP